MRREATLSDNLSFVIGGSCLVAVVAITIAKLTLEHHKFDWEGFAAALFFTLLGWSHMRRGYDEVHSREEDPADVPKDAAPPAPAEHDVR